MDNRPIGVFDSGLGGLTTVKALRRLLPGEDIVYFGDTGRVPYGTRGREIIRKYTRQDMEFLRSHDVKLIIVACGTASSNLTPAMVEEIGLPVSGVVLPAAKAAVAASKGGRIGVVGTPATIRTGAYEQEIRRLFPEAEVTSAACSLFVPLVENGFVDPENEITQKVAQMYLEPIIKAQVDTLILGCTHYPLLYEIIDRILERKVRLIDSGEEVARWAGGYLEQNGLQQGDGQGNCRFFVSDYPEGFVETGGLFLGEDIKGDVTQVDLDKLFA